MILKNLTELKRYNSINIRIVDPETFTIKLEGTYKVKEIMEGPFADKEVYKYNPHLMLVIVKDFSDVYYKRLEKAEKLLTTFESNMKKMWIEGIISLKDSSNIYKIVESSCKKYLEEMDTFKYPEEETNAQEC